jgi:hypothetical protein
MMRNCWLFLCLLPIANGFAAPIQVQVDRQTVSLNESFRITFSTTEDPDANPDFSPLAKEFDIINQNHGSSSSWINGVSSSTIQWTFDVMAKHTGKVTIPALHFGSETSRALEITVTKSAAQTDIADNQADLFLQVEAVPKQSYVQAQIIYTVRIFTRIKIAEGKLSEPEIADAVVTKLGEDKSYNKQINGTDYSVIERSYAIFPQKSGTLTIAPLTLTAAIVEDDQSGFGGIFGAQATRRERVSSKAIILNVLPAPATFKGHWLAAEQLELKQKWSGDVQNMKVGEPLTRTLTLTAQGTTNGQLPSLYQASDNEDLKSYPDQPKLDEQKTPQGITALREEKIAFIPSKAGTYTLPALEIPWFNIKTQQMETAKIPAVTVVATGTGKVAEAKTAASVDKTVENTVGKQAVMHTPAVAVAATTQNTRLWQGLAAFFALGWLITAIFLFKKTVGSKKPSVTSSNLAESNDKTYVADLKKACAVHDAQAAKHALLAWGKEHYHATTLGGLTEFCDARLSQEILQLNQVLYGQQAQTWDGKRLFQAFSEHRAMAKAKPKVDDKLEPLHRI